MGTLNNTPQEVGARGYDSPKPPKKVEQALERECRRLRIALTRECVLRLLSA